MDVTCDSSEKLDDDRRGTTFELASSSNMEDVPAEDVGDGQSSVCAAEEFLIQKPGGVGCSSRVQRTTPTYPRKCADCGKILETASKYRGHREYHHGKKKLANERSRNSLDASWCQICGNVLKNKEFLQRHLKRVHWRELNQTEPKFPCRHCDRVYAARSSRNYHEVTVHKPKSMKCDVCSLEFKCLENLNKHKKLHDSNSFRCFKCRALFTCVDSFKAHCSRLHPEVQFTPDLIVLNENAELEYEPPPSRRRASKKSEILLYGSEEGNACIPISSVVNIAEVLEHYPDLLQGSELDCDKNILSVATTSTAVTDTDVNDTLENSAGVDGAVHDDTETLQIDAENSNIDTDDDILHMVVSVTNEDVQTGNDNAFELAAVSSLAEESFAREESSPSQCSERLEVGSFDLNQIGGSVMNVSDTADKLEYRCQLCCVLFDDSETLMKHCIMKHKDIAQVILL